MRLLVVLPLQNILQKLSRVAFCHSGNLFRRSGRYNTPPGCSTFWTNIDQIISHLDHIKVVFDHNYRITLIHQLVQHVEQHPHVLEMQPRGRLVQDVERPARITFGQLRREFDPLALSTG